MIEMVPVGAMDVSVALRRCTPWEVYILCCQLGNPPPLARQFGGGATRFPRNELHELSGKRHRLLAAIGNPQSHEQVRETHHPQANFTVGKRRCFDLRQWIAVHHQHVIQKPDGLLHDIGKTIPLHVSSVLLFLDEVRRVDGTQVAGFIREQGHFTTGIGRLDASERRQGMRAVDRIQKDEAGITGGPGGLDDLVEDLACVQSVEDPATRRVAQCISLVALQGFHKGVADADRQIEITERTLRPFGVDEGEDIGVIDGQDAHIGSTPLATELDVLGRAVKDLHKGNRPRGGTAGRGNQVPCGAQPTEIEAGAATRALHQGHITEGSKDGLHAIFHGQHEARRELPQGCPGVHQGRRIGQEVEAGQEPVEPLLPQGGLLPVAQQEFGVCDGACYAGEELLGCFIDPALGIPPQIAGLQHPVRVLTQLHAAFLLHAQAFTIVPS